MSREARVIRVRGKLLLLAGVVGAVAVLAAAGALILHLEARYGPVEPQAPGQHASIINDTSETVTVEVPNSGTFQLRPRESTIIVNPNYGDRTQTVTVLTGSGKQCLTVRYDPQVQTSAYVSRAKPCTG
jgi:hypothetical protein